MSLGGESKYNKIWNVKYVVNHLLKLKEAK